MRAAVSPSLLWPWCRSLLAGGTATLVHWLTMAALLALGCVPWLATALGALNGALTNYPLQRRCISGRTAPHARALPRYVGVLGLGAVANLLLFSCLHHGLGLPTSLAQLLTSGGLAILNLWLFQRRVFR